MHTSDVHSDDDEECSDFSIDTSSIINSQENFDHKEAIKKSRALQELELDTVSSAVKKCKVINEKCKALSPKATVTF